MPALGHNSERVGSTKTKGAATVPRHALAVREAMLVICRARGWQFNCKLAWPGTNMSVCGGLGRLLCGVAEQLVEGRTKKPRLFSQRSDSRTCALGHISELVGSTKDGAEAVPGLALAACGAMLFDAKREAGIVTACWLSAERAGLVVEAWISSSAGLQRNGQSRISRPDLSSRAYSDRPSGVSMSKAPRCSVFCT